MKSDSTRVLWKLCSNTKPPIILHLKFISRSIFESAKRSLQSSHTFSQWRDIHVMSHWRCDIISWCLRHKTPKYQTYHQIFENFGRLYAPRCSMVLKRCVWYWRLMLSGWLRYIVCCRSIVLEYNQILNIDYCTT